MTHLRTASLLAIFAGLFACGGGEDAPGERVATWDEFKAAAYQEADTGVFITNGDELAESEADLQAAYDRYLGELTTGEDGTVLPAHREPRGRPGRQVVRGAAPGTSPTA